MVRIGRWHRVGTGVGDAPVHGLEPCGVRISEPGDLNGRNPPREHGQAIATGVPRQVDNDVQLVGKHEGFRLIIIQFGDFPPEGRLGTNASRDVIDLVLVVIADDLEPVAIVTLEDRLEEERDDVETEIRRYITDAQAILRGLAPEARGGTPGEEVAAEAPVGVAQALRRLGRTVVQRHQEVAPGICMVRLPGDDALACFQGFPDPALLIEEYGKIHQGFNAVRHDLEGTQGAGLGLRETPLQEIERALRQEGFVEPGPEFDRPRKGDLRSVGVP